MNFTDLRILKTEERLQNALLGLLKDKDLKAITVKEICDSAGISRNAFYQHYSFKEDLFDQMAARATEKIQDAFVPVIPDYSQFEEGAVSSYVRRILAGISEVKELLSIMLKRDDGKFLRQLTDLIFEQNLANALSFFDLQDSEELRLFYEFQSAGIAAFIIRWILDKALSEEKASELLTEILLQVPAHRPKQGSSRYNIQNSGASGV